MELILEAKGDVNSKSKFGETPLHYAVRLGRKDIVQCLISGGADFTLKGLKSNMTPYELAVAEQIEPLAVHLKKIQGNITLSKHNLW